LLQILTTISKFTTLKAGSQAFQPILLLFPVYAISAFRFFSVNRIKAKKATIFNPQGFKFCFCLNAEVKVRSLGGLFLTEVYYKITDL
jgi:hypothetical protein